MRRDLFPTALPSFDVNQQVSAITAKQDQIELKVGKWTLSGHQTDIDQLRRHMSCPTQEQLRDGDYDVLRFSHLFRCPNDSVGLGGERQTNHPRRPEMFLRAKPFNHGNHHVPAPIFSGHWMFSSYSLTQPLESTRTTTRLALKINPTRFIRHQNPEVFSSSQRPPYQASYRLSNWQGEFDGEFSLDGNDNWIPAGNWETFTRHANWSQHLALATTGFFSFFEEELYRIIRVNSLPVQGESTEEINLQYCETYWEFFSRAPIFAVKQLREIASQFSGNDLSITTYKSANHHMKRIEHSDAIIIEAGAGRQLAIYAKTNKRIRIEVRHRMNGDHPFRIPTGESPRERSSGRGSNYIPNKHTSESYADLKVFIGMLAQDAADLVNRFFSFMRDQSVSIPSDKTVFDLLTMIYQCANSPSHALTLASFLVHQQQIRSLVIPEEFKPGLQGLVRAGVLARNRAILRQGGYSVTPAYSLALANLRAASGLIEEMPRARYRQPLGFESS